MHFPHPILVGDIGGTTTRLARIQAPGTAPQTLTPCATSHAALERAIAAAGVRSVLLGVAGPAVGRAVSLTNTPVAIDGPDWVRRFGLDQGLLLNDFEAEALALPAIGPQHCRFLAGAAGDHGPRLITGPGTGLGTGVLVDVDGRYLAIGSEAGHVGFAAETAEEDAIWAVLRREGRVCPETILSGAGLSRLHDARLVANGRPPGGMDARALVAAALAEPASAAATTARLFWRLMARYAGDMALAFRATGGVWLTGDLLRALEPLCDTGELHAAFIAKPPYEYLLRPIQIQIVTTPGAALGGLARIAARPDDYVIAYAKRCWRS